MGKTPDDMTQNEMLAFIRARHDQEVMKGRDWFTSTPEEHRVQFWGFLNSDFEDPSLELMSRLALIAFETMIIDHYSTEKQGDGDAD